MNIHKITCYLFTYGEPLRLAVAGISHGHPSVQPSRSWDHGIGQRVEKTIRTTVTMQEYKQKLPKKFKLLAKNSYIRVSK